MPSAPIDVSYAIRYISDRIVNYDKPECLGNWCQEVLKKSKSRRLQNKMKDRIFRKLKRIEKLGGYSLMEKLQLAFIFSRSVSDEFVKMLKDAKFEIQLDGKRRISRFSTEDGTIVRSSDHHRDVKYFKGVRCLNTPWQRYMAREKEHGQQDVENEDPDSEMMEEVESIEPEEIDDSEEDIAVELAIGEDVRHAAFNGHINYEELDAQEFYYPGYSQDEEPETRSSTNIEQTISEPASPEYLNTSIQPPPLETTIKTPDEPKISVMVLVSNIKNIAEYYNLEKLQKKASQAISKMNKTGEYKTLSVKKFNISINFLLICLEENRIREVSENSIPLKALFEQLQMFLIRPLGPEVVHEALEMILQKIQEFENEDDGVSPVLISESLNSLMIAAGFYNE